MSSVDVTQAPLFEETMKPQMTVKRLIEELQKYDPETVVVMSSDAEGNGYSPLAGIYTGEYVPNSTWSGEIYYDEEDDELEEEEIDEDDEVEEFDGSYEIYPCIILTPVN